jgi:pyrimidine deaminase RibD-like protein
MCTSICADRRRVACEAERSGIMPEDKRFMQHALDLAALAKGLTYPNPAVGCVIVAAGSVVGEGFHPRAGEPHAEVFALRAAGQRAIGATAYVTLEPCNHYGLTPPCSNALVEAQVARVRTAALPVVCAVSHHNASLNLCCYYLVVIVPARIGVTRGGGRWDRAQPSGSHCQK